MNRTILDRGRGIAGDDFERFATIPLSARLFVDGAGNLKGIHRAQTWTNFSRPPAAAVAVGTELDVITISTGTVQIATQPTTKGGCNIKTRSASAGTDGDLAGLKPALTTNGFNVPIRAGSLAMFEARIALTTITKIIAGIGLDQNITRFDPTATANDGCGFLFVDDPTQMTANPGLTAGAANTGGVVALVPANPYTYWICSQKIGGADTFIATNVPVLAGVDYELSIEVGPDLKPRYSINGVLVGTGVALGANTLSVMVGVEIGGDATGDTVKERDIDIRHISLSRAVGA